MKFPVRWVGLGLPAGWVGGVATLAALDKIVITTFVL